MVWAHNAHIAEDYPQESLRNTKEAVMGMHLHQRWGDQLYTIGLYMVGGQQADNTRTVTAMTPHQPDSLESLFARLAQSYDALLVIRGSQAPAYIGGN